MFDIIIYPVGTTHSHCSSSSPVTCTISTYVVPPKRFLDDCLDVRERVRLLCSGLFLNCGMKYLPWHETTLAPSGMPVYAINESSLPATNHEHIDIGMLK